MNEKSAITNIPPPLQVMLHEYDTLREEILQGIRLQYQIMTVQATILAAIFALGISYPILFIAIPFIFVMLTHLWIVEQNRMMRAGNYIQMIEDKINEGLGGAYLLWENWLRSEKEVFYIKVQENSQLWGILGTNFAIIILTVSLLWILKVLPIEHLAIFIIAYAILIFFVLRVVIKVVRFSPYKRNVFNKFSQKYMKSLLEETGKGR